MIGRGPRWWGRSNSLPVTTYLRNPGGLGHYRGAGPSLLEVPCGHDGRLVCLREIMKEFAPDYIVHYVQVFLTEASRTPETDQTIIGPTHSLNLLLDDLVPQFKERGLTSAYDLLVRLRVTIREPGGLPAGEMVGLTMDLMRRIQDDMKRSVYLRLEGDESAFYEGTKPTWGNAFSVFDIQQEAEEGARCYAVGRYPATAFHMMRVLEVGLNSLAAELQVDYEHKNWENVINEVESKLRQIDKSQDPDRKAKVHFYSEVALHFRFLKDAWRNYVMHVKERCTQSMAHSTLGHVSEMMGHLANKRPWLS